MLSRDDRFSCYQNNEILLKKIEKEYCYEYIFS